MGGKCTYAQPGTWGHRCGKPAKWAQHDPNPEDEGTFWVGGYWVVRCDACKNYTGPDNYGMRRDSWEPYNPNIQINTFRLNCWPNPPELVSKAA